MFTLHLYLLHGIKGLSFAPPDYMRDVNGWNQFQIICKSFDPVIIVHEVLVEFRQTSHNLGPFPSLIGTKIVKRNPKKLDRQRPQNSKLAISQTL